MIYLDAAATTFQKPRTVAAAVERAMHYMTTPGRGAYQEARLAAETAFRCRSEAAALFHVPGEDNVVFTFNATHEYCGEDAGAARRQCRCIWL